MFRKSITILSVATLAILANTGCTKSSDGPGSPSSSTAVGNHATTAVTAATYVPGTAAHASDVVSLTVFATEGGAASGAALPPIFAAYPALGTAAAELANINRSVLTTDSHIELYDVNTLVMVLAISGSDAVVSWTRSGFTAESITYTADTTNPQSMNSTLKYDLKACTAGTSSGDQNGGQDKGQDKGQSKEPVCQTISALIDMTEQVQKQDQVPTPTPTQDKGQDKGQTVPTPTPTQDKGQTKP